MNEIEKIINQEYKVENNCSLVENKLNDISFSKKKKKNPLVIWTTSIAVTLILATIITFLSVHLHNDSSDVTNDVYFGNTVEIIKKTKSAVVKENDVAIIDIEFYVEGASDHNLVLYRYIDRRIKPIELTFIGMDKYSIKDEIDRSQFVKESGMIFYSLDVDNKFCNLSVCNYDYEYHNSGYIIK